MQSRTFRVVAYSRERGTYLSYSCLGETDDRTWAWSGTLRQARNMVRVFPEAERFDIYWSGEEKTGGTALDVT